MIDTHSCSTFRMFDFFMRILPLIRLFCFSFHFLLFLSLDRFYSWFISLWIFLRRKRRVTMTRRRKRSILISKRHLKFAIWYQKYESTESFVCVFVEFWFYSMFCITLCIHFSFAVEFVMVLNISFLLFCFTLSPDRHTTCTCTIQWTMNFFFFRRIQESKASIVAIQPIMKSKAKLCGQRQIVGGFSLSFWSSF